MNIKDFAEARTKAVDGELPSGGWRVYERYEVVEDRGGVFVYAPPPAQRLAEHPATEGFPAYKSFNDSMVDWGIREVYAPLKYDDMFLEMATLVERGPVTAAVVQEWAQQYGLLDYPAGFAPVTFTTDPAAEEVPAWFREYNYTDRLQSVSEFFLFARDANRCLRLYENAIAEQWPGHEVFERYGIKGNDPYIVETYGIKGDDPESIRRAALMEAMSIVGKNLEAHCYPVLYYHKDTGQPLRKKTGWGFHNLRGALYIQMARLLVADPEALKRCAYPPCTKLIGLGRSNSETERSGTESKSTRSSAIKKNDRSTVHKKTHANKKFCSDEHRYKYHNEYVRKSRRG